MAEYFKLNHMELISDETEKFPQQVYYLPHHGVLKGSSQKLRVVFDGSAKSSNGYSLNDNLLVGPTIQEDLFSIVLRFRSFQFVLTADITKMYRQILLHLDDQNFQRILWREDPSQPLNTYKLTTVTYGTASAPFLAVRSLQQLAIEEKQNFPLAYPIVSRDFYVDDLLTGSNSIEHAGAIRDELIEMLSRGGFELRKWTSNSRQLLPNNDINQPTTIGLTYESQNKVLGLNWNSESDDLRYLTNFLPTNDKHTKRSVLATIAKIFDPLGLIGPVVIKTKILLQRLWSLKLDWDAPLPQDLTKEWEYFLKHLSYINEFQIPRKIIPFFPYEIIELHAFSDASSKAYGACIYIRTCGNNKTATSLVCAKSKVAPLKTISLPRLELCGAVLMVKLFRKATRSLNLNFSKTYFWTDSTIVLDWINSDSSNFKTFVANRVSEIQSITSQSSWHHIISNDNPADIISRGLSPKDLNQHSLWWHGPTWLSKPSNMWPRSHYNKKSINPTLPEQRARCCLLTCQPLPFNLLHKYSSFIKLIRVTATCIRFINNLKSKSKVKGNLTCKDINQATNIIIRLVQAESFPKEAKHLINKTPIHKSSKLLPLRPFIDDEGLIRVGGRLQNSFLPFDQKHQILLPYTHYVTTLIIEHYHQIYLHAGPLATLAAIRQKYWPIGGRSLVRKVLFKCVKCFRSKPVISKPIMGNLPYVRVQQCRPFINSGIDYAGPILIKEGHGRGKKSIKAYVALFVCLATKAVHIELVCDLTSSSFLNSLKRFMARRGKIKNIYCDNSTTFVGARKELNAMRNFINSKHFREGVVDIIANEGIDFHFIPPRSPHFGGLWEAGVKSCKTHLKRVVGNALLTYEEMYTVLTAIESCLNSRPITPLSSNPEDFIALTPSHFLLGDVITAPVEANLTDLPMNRLNRYQVIEQVRQHFWKRWSREYLSQLQQRTKWQHDTANKFNIGSLVVLHDENSSPLQWRLGRIIQQHPGSDGVCRVVSVKCANGIFKRSVTKLSVLPIDDD